MPDPLLYGKVLLVAAAIGALVAWVLGGRWRQANAWGAKSAGLLAVVGGVAVGLYVLQGEPAWPPRNALDRLLSIVLPAALVIEWLARLTRRPQGLVWLVRIGLAAVAPRILLHGSVYLGGANSEWRPIEALAALMVCGALLAIVWFLLVRLAERSPGKSIPLALALSMLSAGLAIMLRGYVTGGATALPLAAALAGAAIAGSRATMEPSGPALVSLAVVALFGLLSIGVFFGRLPVSSAVVILIAPLGCWITSLTKLRDSKPWLHGTLRLLVVAIPLIIVLVLAKRHFDRHTAPLVTILNRSHGIQVL